MKLKNKTYHHQQELHKSTTTTTTTTHIHTTKREESKPKSNKVENRAEDTRKIREQKEGEENKEKR